MFKIAVVKASINSDKTIAEIADDNCIGESTLFKWRKDLLVVVEESLRLEQNIYKRMYEELEKKYYILKNKLTAVENKNDQLLNSIKDFMQEISTENTNT